jgi:hypothetical protein
MLAIPPQNLKLALDGQYVELDVDTATLEAAHGVDRANLPEHAEPTLRASAPLGRTRADSHKQR